MKLTFVTIIFVFFSTSTALFEVLTPSSVAGEYPHAPLQVKPSVFNVSGRLVMADPENGCYVPKNADAIKGNIAFTSSSTNCLPNDRAKIMKEAGAIGLVMWTSGMGGSFLGYLYYNGGKAGKYEMPSLQIKDAEKLRNAVLDGEIVIIDMASTTHNPWKEFGQGASGISFQTFFLLYAVIVIGLGSYKLYHFMSAFGPQFSVTQICLSLEIGSAIFRMLYFFQPLSFHGVFWDGRADAILQTIGENLSFMSTLLMSFYWQEIMKKASTKLDNRILNNLDKMKIPFAIAALALWVTGFMSMLGRAHAVQFPTENIFTVASVVYGVECILLALFFAYTGGRILRLTTKAARHMATRRKLNRVAILVITCSTSLTLIFIAEVLFISPVGAAGQGPALFCWWLFYIGGFTGSFAKVYSFISPQSVQSSEPEKQQKSDILLKKTDSVNDTKE